MRPPRVRDRHARVGALRLRLRRRGRRLREDGPAGFLGLLGAARLLAHAQQGVQIPLPHASLRPATRRVGALAEE